MARLLLWRNYTLRHSLRMLGLSQSWGYFAFFAILLYEYSKRRAMNRPSCEICEITSGTARPGTRTVKITVTIGSKPSFSLITRSLRYFHSGLRFSWQPALKTPVLASDYRKSHAHSGAEPGFLDIVQNPDNYAFDGCCLVCPRGFKGTSTVNCTRMAAEWWTLRENIR